MANKNKAGKYANAEATGGKKTRVVLIICIILALAVLLSLLAVGYLYFGNVPKDLIIENVRIDGVYVGGMTKDQAVSAVTSAFEKRYADNPMVVRVLEHEIQIPLSVSKVTVDASALVEQAFTLGRTGTIAQRRADKKTAETTGFEYDVRNYITMDLAAIRGEVDKLLANYSTVLTQSRYELVGEIPDLTVLPEAPAAPETHTEAESTDAEPLIPVEGIKLVITIGTPGYDLDAAKIVDTLQKYYLDEIFDLTVDCTVTVPDPLDIDAIYKEFYTAPVDASFDEATFDVLPHFYGYHFDVEEGRTLLQDTVYEQVIELSFTYLKPEVYSESLEALLYKDLLSSFTAVSESEPDRDVNLKIACNAINNVIILPGQTFDYNVILGPRTPERGYRPGGTYEGGQVVKTYGGGICQVSSAVYYCAMLADMKITNRTNHGYLSGYVPFGMDATVSWGGPEFRFVNTSDYPIKIVASAKEGATTIKIYGTDNRDYFVKMDFEILETREPDVYIEEVSVDNNPNGYTDGEYIINPVIGYRISTFRCKYSKATKKLISMEHEVTSSYNKRNGHMIKLIDPNAPSEPPVDETDPSTPSDPTTPSEPTPPSGEVTPTPDPGGSGGSENVGGSGGVTEDA